MVDNSLSKKITVLSFVAMVAVVMIHSHALGTFEEAASWCVFLQTFFFRAITAWAVPFFFVVSGYFFAKSTYFRQTGGGYGHFIAKKARTLLVPYLLWTIIGTAISVPLIMGNNFIMHRALLERTFLANGIGLKALDLLLGITSNGPSGNLALWYVRTLLIFFAVAPLWKFVLRLNKTLTVVCGLLLVVFCSELWIPYTGLKYSSFGWLFLGVGIAELGIENLRFSSWLVIVSGCVYFSSSLYVGLGGLDNFAVIPVSGVLFWWGLYDRFKLPDKALPSVFFMTFWVYCLHGVITGWFMSVTLFVFGKSSISVIIASVSSIVGSLIIALWIGRLVRQKWPKFYLVLSGGR